MLAPEQNTLAILKWRFLNMSPANRWFPVMQRYITYLSARVNALGGDASKVKPSPQGYWELPTGQPEKCLEYTGKICQVLYNCYGEFEGFILKDCSKEQLIKSNEPQIGELVIRALRERLKISIFVDKKDKNRICKVIIRC